MHKIWIKNVAVNVERLSIKVAGSFVPQRSCCLGGFNTFFNMKVFRPLHFVKHTSISLSESDAISLIDRSMEIHYVLYEFTLTLNLFFQFQLLVVCLTAFIIIVFDCFYLLVLLNGFGSCKYNGFRKYHSTNKNISIKISI